MTKKNVLVLTGSPRIKGNSDLLADAFIKGARDAGHNAVKCETAQKHVMGCKACDTCYSKGKPCSFDDDFNNIASLIEQADVIVLATPMYGFTFPAQLKAVMDKMYAFLVGQRKLKIKESILLVCAGAGNKSKFDGIVTTYRLITEFYDWTNKGCLIVPGVLNKKDILSTDYLNAAEKMGYNI